MSQQPQQTLPPAPDSPALVVTSNVQKYAIKKKKVLNAEETELFELTQAAGITVDQEVFKIIVDLLKMNVAPQAVFQTLKAMCAGQRVADSCGGEAPATATTSLTTAPTEARGELKSSPKNMVFGGFFLISLHMNSVFSSRAFLLLKEEDSLVSGKSPKPPAAPSSAPGPRATRVNTKIVVYGPQDASSSHSQGPFCRAVSSISICALLGFCQTQKCSLCLPSVRNKAGASHSEKSREASSQRVQRQPSATRGQKTKSSGSSSSSSQVNST
ncbi:unnamed protein product [Menidia menidia]|uniref:(Atlantic silverside) hypothetical protein n=1 Tax=Menidia menidia TaxID=238744 RepID=A0A8S4ALJ7_9TELE|nr:unnamed protein product [Menidia menidia]